jgi:oxygen-dependent protoporphyrinogen oxidase
MPKVVIVGAGISGLALAYRFRQLVPSAEVTVLEQRDRPGGTLWTDRREGFQVEIGPNGFLDNKPTTERLCRDLGLAERLLPATEVSARNRYLFLDDKLRRLPTSLVSFLKSDLLTWRGKLSVLMERFRRSRAEEADETVDAFVRRRAGSEAALTLADALVTGIYAGDPTLLSVRAAFPLVAQLEARYGSVIKGLAETARRRRAEAAARGEHYHGRSRLWSFREGLSLLIEVLCDRLPKPPVLGVAVRRLEMATTASAGQPRWTVISDGQNRWHAEAVVLTCPAYRQANILADLDQELAEHTNAIPYNRLAVVALGYRESDMPTSLGGFGYIAPQRTRRDVLGVQWCSSIFPNRTPPGLVLLRAMCGGWNRPEIVDWDDARLLQAVRSELRLAMRIEAAPLFHHIIRWDRAIPQYLLGHLERVAWIEDRCSRHPGLFLAGNAYHGVALNDCTEQAETLASRLASFLKCR